MDDNWNLSTKSTTEPTVLTISEPFCQPKPQPFAVRGRAPAACTNMHTIYSPWFPSSQHLEASILMPFSNNPIHSLQPSCHCHGNQTEITDRCRSSVTVELTNTFAQTMVLFGCTWVYYTPLSGLPCTPGSKQCRCWMVEKLLTTVCVCVCVWVSVCIAPKSPHPKRTIIRPPDRFDDAESVAHIRVRVHKYTHCVLLIRPGSHRHGGKWLAAAEFTTHIFVSLYGGK